MREFGGNTFSSLTITGDLTVQGNTQTSTNTTITDKLIELANGTTGTPAGDSGIIVERGDSANAAMVWDESGDTWVAATTAATGASTGDLTLTPTDLQVSDLALKPDGITTSHIVATNSLKIRASDSLDIGDDGADSVKIGRTNTTAAKVHLRSGADTDLVVSNGKVGIGTDTPTAELEVSGAVKLTNVTAGAWEATDIAIAHGGTGSSSAADARTALGVAIGSDVQAFDADLTALSSCQTGSAAALALLTATEIAILDGATLSTAELNYVDGVTSAIQTQIDGKSPTAGSASIATVGTVTTGTWNGTPIASAYLDADTAHLSGTQTFTGAKTFSADVVISGTTPQLTIGDAGAEDTLLVFDGSAADFRIGIDDGTDTLEIGKGAAHGTDAVIKIASTSNLTMMLNSAVADGEYSGTVALFTANEDLTAGEVVYLTSGGKMAKAVATAAATSRAVAMAVAPISADAMGPFLLRGFERCESESPAYTVGGALYTPESETSSKNVPEQTAPDTDGDFVQVLGYAVSADSVYFDPDSTVIEVA
jgi:hypothetical protein